MSLINQMLKDLEQRKAEATKPHPLPDSIHVVDQTRSPGRSLRGIILVAVSLLVAAGAGGWWFVGKIRNPPTAAAPVAVTPSPVMPVSPDRLEPAPEVVSPVVVMPGETPVAQPQTMPEQPPATPQTRSDQIASQHPANNKQSTNPVPAQERRPTEDLAPSPVAKKIPKARQRVTSLPVSHFESNNSGDTADDHYRQALRLMEGGAETQAQQELETVLRLAPDHVEARILLAKCYAATGQYHRADSVLTEIPTNREALDLRAQIYLKQGKTEQADKVLNGTAIDGDTPESLALMAALRQQQGRYEEAAALYGKAIRAQPRQAKWWLGRAIALEASERYQQALVAYQRVLNAGAPTREVQRYVESRISALLGSH